MARESFGVFNGEGCVEDGFYSMGAAEAVLAEIDGDDCYVATVCPDHDGHEKGNCEKCAELEAAEEAESAEED